MRWLLPILLCGLPCMAQVPLSGSLSNHAACYIFDVDFGAAPQSLTLTADVTLLSGGTLELEMFDLDGAAALATPVRQSPEDFASAQADAANTNAVAVLNTRTYDGVRRFLLIITDAGEGAEFSGTFSDSAAGAVLAYEKIATLEGLATIVHTPRSVHFRAKTKGDNPYPSAEFLVDSSAFPDNFEGHFGWQGDALRTVQLRLSTGLAWDDLFQVNYADPPADEDATAFSTGEVAAAFLLRVDVGRNKDFSQSGDELRLEVFLPATATVENAYIWRKRTFPSGSGGDDRCSAGEGSSLTALIVLLGALGWLRLRARRKEAL